ncbi:MAG: hypothetical protein CVT77_00855 [Alphaproteobacteria bacterium HGW-Alphaproteobacteria-16]|nr:MAG: hypothetical protein CVT77_00855 [Alphaproteobacteria bacterium HGW-Alphaproteobacteria-16]
MIQTILQGIFAVIALLGFAVLAWMSLKSLWTGRLDYLGMRWTSSKDASDILRSERPFKFWLNWMCLAFISFIPLCLLLAISLYSLVFGDG